MTGQSIYNSLFSAGLTQSTPALMSPHGMIAGFTPNSMSPLGPAQSAAALASPLTPGEMKRYHSGTLTFDMNTMTDDLTVSHRCRIARELKIRITLLESQNALIP